MSAEPITKMKVMRTGRPPTIHRWTIEDRGYETPCWIWQLAQMGQGYGCEWDRGRGRMVQAHILAFEREYGPTPPGLELDHLCRVRLCVNPDHLEAVSHAENVRRGNYRGNGRPITVPCPSLAAYKRGCRCDACRALNTEKTRRRRARVSGVHD